MKYIAILVACLLLAACAIGREQLALRDVPLAADAMPGGLVPLRTQLQIEPFRAAEPLSGARIAVHDAGGGYAVLPRVRWREPAPQLVQSLLVQAFEQCRCLAGVARAGATARADYVLTGELRELAVDDGAAEAAAIVRLSLSLVHARDGRVVATTQIERRTSLAARSDAAGIVALAASLNAGAVDAVTWAHATLVAAQTPERTP